MRRLVLGCMLLLLPCVNEPRAAENSPPVPVPVPVPVLPRAAAPARRPDNGRSPAPGGIVPRPAAGRSSIDHLRKAAEHLEAAGHADDAARLRTEAREKAIRENLIAAKEAELDCLLRELDELRELTGQSQMIEFHLVALEFSRSRLGDESAALDQALGLGDAPPGSDAEAEGDRAPAAAPPRQMGLAVVPHDPLTHLVLSRLRARGLVNVLAEPTLISTSGRPASFLSGGQFPVPLPAAGGQTSVRMVTHGVQLELVAVSLPERRLRLQTRFELSEPDRTHTVTIAGIEVPGLTSRSVNTEIELLSGETKVISHLSRQRVAPADGAAEAAPDTELIVLITPRLLGEPPALQPVPTDAEDAAALEKLLLPAGVVDDFEYFPASPILPRGSR